MHRNIHFQRIVFTFTMAVLLIMPVSCFRNYYKISKRPVTASESDITSHKNESRYFILRNGNQAWHMRNINVSADQNTIHCELEDIPFAHQLHLRGGEHQNMQYMASRATRAVLSEVLFYIPFDTLAKYGAYILDSKKVSHIEIIQKDQLRSIGSQLGGVVVIAATLFAGALAVAALTSCPFVSPYDGKQFSMQGEIYGGAVYPQLSRNDFIRLNMAPTPDGDLQLKISNELKEIQNTDLAELITITHSKDVSILNDQNGNIYSIKNALQPVSAFASDRNDVTTLVAAKDEHFVELNDSSSANGANSILLNFKKPAGVQQGKLVLRVRNTFWLDKLYGKMLEGFGDYYNTFVEGQKKKPAEELTRWIDEQMIPLTVSVKTKDGWKKVTGLKTSGPVAYRDVLVPLDLSDVSGSLTQVKLSSGFMFWDVDYAGLDYSENEILTIEKQDPVTAIDEAGKNVTQELSTADDSYLIQPQPGNVTTVTYKYSQPPQGQMHTYILHSKGWYETIRDFKGKPNITFLNHFKKPGSLSKFSVDVYRKEKASTEITVKN